MMSAPYIHTNLKANERSRNWLVALIPVLIWSTFMFGARVLTLCAVGAICALILDYPIQRFIFKFERGARFDLMAAVYAVLAVFTMPVTVPLWMPAVSSVLVVVAKNLYIFRPKRLFNPFVLSAAVLNFVYPNYMTWFTRPFAYFSATAIELDPKLVEGYRVLSPLQYIADGSVFEDGLPAQLYGFASGNIGEIAIFAIILSAFWLFIRKEVDWIGTVSMVAAVFVCAFLLPSDDAETNHYAFSVILSGGIIFLSVFAMGEISSLPITSSGRMLCGLLCGIAIFAARKWYGGYEWSYCIVLAMNVVAPLIEKITKPAPLKARKVKNNEE